MRPINLFTASVTWQFSVFNRVYEVVEKEISFGIEHKGIMFAYISFSPFFVGFLGFGFFCCTVA